MRRINLQRLLLVEDLTIRQLCATILSEIDPVVTSEQKFCNRFLHVSSDSTTFVMTDDLTLMIREKQTMSAMFGKLDTHLQAFMDEAKAIEPSLVVDKVVDDQTGGRCACWWCCRSRC